MESLTHPFHVHRPAEGSPCAMCKAPKVGEVEVWDNSRMYTSTYFITFCEEHREEAKNRKKKAEARECRLPMWV